MTEDDNEGAFGTPPPTGNFVPLASSASLSTLTYHPTSTRSGAGSRSDADVREIVERGGLGRHLTLGADREHALRPPAVDLPDRRRPRPPPRRPPRASGPPGLFVTDGAAVPTSLCVNPSLTIAAMAERAAHLLVRRGDLGLEVTPGAPPPGNGSLGPGAPTSSPVRVLPATGGSAALGMAAAGAAAALAGRAALRTSRPLRATDAVTTDAGPADARATDAPEET
jgi:enediyne biosynthesis protein E9